MYKANWIVVTNHGNLEIDKNCGGEIHPCSHDNSKSLSSVGIWRCVKQHPELRQGQPDLWYHFKKFDAPEYENWPSGAPRR